MSCLFNQACLITNAKQVINEIPSLGTSPISEILGE